MRVVRSGPARTVALAVVQAVAVAIAVVVVTFALVHIVPGDPARQALGPEAPQQTVDALRHQLGLDRPLPTQFVDFVGDAVQGDLGESITFSGRSVLGIVASGLGVTLVLIAATVILSTLLGVPLGLIAATSRRPSIDRSIRLTTIALLATPPFFVGIVLILLLAVNAGIAPAGGWGDGYPDNLRYLWMPTLALSCYLTPVIARVTRQRARAILAEQFIDAAISRGLSLPRLTLRHVLPNSALPVIALIGLNAGALIGGAVVVEAVFGLPGLGSVLVRAVSGRDYPVIQGTAIVAGVVVVCANMLAEAAGRLIDPRTRA